MRGLSRAVLGAVSSHPAHLTSAPRRRSATVRVSLADRVATTIAMLSLLGILLASLLMVVIAAERPSFLTPTSRPGYFPSWMAGPLRGLWPGLTSNPGKLAWLTSAVMGVMFVLYVLAFANARRLPGRWTIAAVLAIHVVFLLAPPMSYTDVFNYVNYGRMGVVHHLNPYSSVPLLEPHGDPSFSLSNWHLLQSPYGPLFTLFTYALVPLGVATSFWAIKLALALASIATLGLVWKCARLLGRSPSAAVLFVGFNPIVLIWGLGADHNDVLMVFFVMLAAYLLIRPADGSRGAGAALVSAAFVKASALVLLPVLLFAARRRSFLIGSAQATLVLGLASLLAFGMHLPNLLTQGNLVTGIGLANLLGLAVGQGGESAPVRIVLTTALALVILGATIRVARRPRDWLAAGAVASMALLVSLSWSAPWYVLWALPFAALLDTPWVRRTLLLYCIYLLLAFAPAAPMLAGAIHFDPDSTRLGMEHRDMFEVLAR